MEDYWSAGGTVEVNGVEGGTNGEATRATNSAPAAVVNDGDIDMIE
jgi:hypothetical protein